MTVRRGYIYHVAVAEKFRGRGIGRILVDKSLERLKGERD
jgi:ribosomal protein S18 acetylase RimI-like enzyme